MAILTNKNLLQTHIETEVLEIIHLLLNENGAHRAIPLLSPTASFERDLGLGSLERVELLIRIESAFSVSLPDSTIAEAETPQTLSKIILKAEPPQKKPSENRIESLKNRAQPIRPARTLNEALTRHAEIDPDRPHIYLSTDEGNQETLTYKDLLEGASAIARGLREKGLRRGETVAIMLPTCKAFFFTFCGTLLAGGIPVPVYPPFRPNQIEEYAKRQEQILRNAEASYLITFQKVEILARLLKPRLPNLRAVLIPETLAKDPQETADPMFLSKEGDPGLIQYTSGSTGDPKGVYLTHENIMANIRSMKKAMHLTTSDVGVSWLPLYHDMGLIGSWLFSMVNGIPIAIMPPFAFLSRPEKWLWTIHRHGGTLSAAPNFAYEICAKKIRDEAIEGLDLSSWRIALNGAEPINPETLRHFSERFEAYGFKAKSILPVYGMAEASVGLTFPTLGRIPRVDKISRERFQKEGEAFPASPKEHNPLEFLSCGKPLSEHEVRIVNDDGAVLGERVEGHIEFRGPSCTSGYYRNQEATASLFHEGWLVSGDLGYTVEDELFITGRKKDIIIKGGRNLHPYEIEGLVGEIEGVRKGCVAAFGIPDKGLGTEKLVVVFETKETEEKKKVKLNATINERMSSVIGMPPDLICALAPGAVLKTSSGKISRSACREAYLNGQLIKRRRRIPLQFLRLFLLWMKASSFRTVNRSGQFIYGTYLILTLSVLLLPTWLLIWIFSEKKTGIILKRSAQLFLKLGAASPSLAGIEFVKKEEQVIWVSNHASYLDVFFLIATLPAGIRFVAKEELLKVPLLKTFLVKGKHITVDRSDVSKGASETQKIEALLKTGDSVLIFPEGTFRATAGLRPFKLGAFKAAVETGIPIVPLTMKGSREFLRDGQWMPQKTPVSVTFCPSAHAKGDQWREVVRLRDYAREEIARHSEEVILD